VITSLGPGSTEVVQVTVTGLDPLTAAPVQFVPVIGVPDPDP
jgi:hypothetical protein